MINSKSTATLSFTIDDGKGAPQTNVFTWPNLGYDKVLLIERQLIAALQGLNNAGQEALEVLEK